VTFILPRVFLYLLMQSHVIISILNPWELTQKFRIDSFSANYNGFWIIIAHLNIETLFKNFRHSWTNLYSDFMFLSTWYLSLHGDNFQERLSLHFFNINLKLKCHFSSIFDIDVLTVPLAEALLGEIQLFLTDFSTYQRRISLELDLVIRSSFNVTDSSGSVKNASLSIVDELYFFDLIWLKHTWKRQNIKDFIDGNRPREHRVWWNVHFLFLTNNLLLQKCPLVCHRHQRDILHQHWYLFCSVIQNSSKVDNRCFHLQIGETNFTN